MAIVVILILIVGIIIIKKTGLRFNLPHGALLCIDGAVKVGKTKCAVTIALRDYKKALLKWKIGKLIGKKEERPLLYSNIPINIKGGYVPVTEELLQRRERLAYKSVCILSEASLVADNNLYKDREAAVRIMLFMKLYGHETKGGTLILESQAIGDISVQIRRCIANKWYIDHATKIPLLGFTILHIRNERYAEEGGTTNIYDGETKMDKLFIPNRIHKVYDSYCYSIYTDMCTVNTRREEPKSLKALKVVSFSKDVVNTLRREYEENR